MSRQLVRTQDLAEARLYENADQVIQDALRHLFLARPDLPVSVAVHRYRTDEELALTQAAAIAGASLERMKEILECHDVPLRLGPGSILTLTRTQRPKGSQKPCVTRPGFSRTKASWSQRSQRESTGFPVAG